MPRVFDNWGCGTGGTGIVLTEADVLALAVKPDYEAAESDAAGILNKPDIPIIDVDKYAPHPDDETFDKELIGDDVFRVLCDIEAKDVVHVISEELLNGVQVDYVVNVKNGFVHTLRIGDGLTYPIVSYEGYKKASGELVTDYSGEFSIRREGGIFRQFRKIKYPEIYTGPLSVSASIDSSNPYVLGFSIDEALGGTGDYDYTATIGFLHPDQGGRKIVLSGDRLGSTPAISDTKAVDNLTASLSGFIVCDDNTSIGTDIVSNGSLQNGFNGSLGDFEIVSSIADLYGPMTFDVTVDDGSSEQVDTPTTDYILHLIGQSNAVGRATSPSGLSNLIGMTIPSGEFLTEANSPEVTAGDFGLDMVLASDWSRARSARLLKTAQGGIRAITFRATYWPEHEALIDAETFDPNAEHVFVWIQGEADLVSDSTASTYQGIENDVFDLIAAKVPGARIFSALLNEAEILGGSTGGDSRHPRVATINAAKIANANARSDVFVFGGNSPLGSDNLHYELAGFLDLSSTLQAAIDAADGL